MKDRRAHDYYPTPACMTDVLMKRLAPSLQNDYLEAPVLCEPCVGEHYLIHAAAPWVPDARWSTNDIDPRFTADSHVDAGTDAFWGLPGLSISRPDWVITNPPFAEAARIIPRAYAAAKVGVAVLLRITWLEPIPDRAQFLAEHPPTWQLVMPRYSFLRNGKQDGATTCWFVWVKDPRSGPQRIEVVPCWGEQPALGEMAL